MDIRNANHPRRTMEKIRCPPRRNKEGFHQVFFLQKEGTYEKGMRQVQEMDGRQR